MAWRAVFIMKSEVPTGLLSQVLRVGGGARGWWVAGLCPGASTCSSGSILAHLVLEEEGISPKGKLLFCPQWPFFFFFFNLPTVLLPEWPRTSPVWLLRVPSALCRALSCSWNAGQTRLRTWSPGQCRMARQCPQSASHPNHSQAPWKKLCQ